MNKIYGVGTDIVDITRIKRSIKNKKFINKIFSDKEIKNSKNKLDSYYGKRFAAKEAFSKALGTGISEGISFNEISILNNDKGQPYIELKRTAWKANGRSCSMSETPDRFSQALKEILSGGFTRTVLSIGN